jgi:hypothetical protein
MVDRIDRRYFCLDENSDGTPELHSQNLNSISGDITLKIQNVCKIGIMLAIIFVGSMSAKTIIIWDHHSEYRANWMYMGVNEWDGVDSWCVASGSRCGEYNWKVEYEMFTPEELDPYLTSVAYGQTNILAAAANDPNLPGPSPTATPTVTVIVE